MFRIALLLELVSLGDVWATTVPWDVTTFGVGYGFNSATGDVRSPRCVTSLATQQDSQTGSTIEMKFRGIDSTETMQQELDASLGASYGGYGVTASAHARYVQANSLSKYEAAYMLKISVIQANPITLAQSVKFDTSLNGRPNLAELCGDSFISRATTGGVLYAVFRVSKESFEQNHGGSVDVAGGGWGAEMEAKIDASVKSASSSGSLTVDILQMGGSGSSWANHQAPLTFELLKEKASTFPGDVDDHPFPFSAVVVPWGQYFPEYNPASQIDASAAQDAMQRLLFDYNIVMDAQKSIDYINGNPNLFGGYSDLKVSCLDPLAIRCAAVLQDIRDAAHSLSVSYTAKIPAIITPDVSCLPAIPSAPSSGYIYGVGDDKQIYEQKLGALTDSSPWNKVASTRWQCIQIVDDTIWGVGDDYHIYRQTFSAMTSETSWTKVRDDRWTFLLIHDGTFWGVGDDQHIYNRPLSDIAGSAPWTQARSDGWLSIAVSGDTIWGVGNDNQIYKQQLSSMTHDTQWILARRDHWISITIHSGLLWGVGDDRHIYFQKLSSLTDASPWTRMRPNDGWTAIAFSPVLNGPAGATETGLASTTSIVLV